MARRCAELVAGTPTLAEQLEQAPIVGAPELPNALYGTQCSEVEHHA